MTMYHFHHIIPRHMGGTDDPDNLIKLTIEEHAEAHKLLYEKYGRDEDRLAWLGLARMIEGQDKIKELTRMAGKKTVEMKVGIHDPTNNLKSIGGSLAIKKMTKWTKNSKWMNNGKEDTRVHVSNLETYISNGWFFWSFVFA